MERLSSMIVGDYSPDGAAVSFSIHLQTNCRLCLLDDIIAGRRLNGLTLVQNEKLRGRACGLLLSYVMLLSPRIKWPRGASPSSTERIMRFDTNV